MNYEEKVTHLLRKAKDLISLCSELAPHGTALDCVSWLEEFKEYEVGDSQIDPDQAEINK